MTIFKHLVITCWPLSKPFFPLSWVDAIAEFLIARSYQLREMDDLAKKHVALASELVLTQEAHTRVALAKTLIENMMLDWAVDVLDQVCDDFAPFSDESTEATLELVAFHFDFCLFLLYTLCCLVV